MNFEIGKEYYGFKLDKKKTIKEINSEAYTFSHVKSGARLLYLKNDDDNKVFSISFRTPPKNSRGVAHILEHSVLCGSRKFPVKEPFVELIKGSLNTFLNALTFADKTMYPIASKNDKDFMNLMDVYLDAVFYPNIYKYNEILMQEGWHYELNKKEDEMSYKGVVYNEMKGAFSSPESVLMRKVSQTLFPDNTYGFESGGDPEEIPKLTQEEFEAFHKKYYHPSNSYIILYGNMDIEKDLKFIDENYLKNFDKIDVDSEIQVQKPFDSIKEVQACYPISSDESDKDKTFLSLNYVVSKSTDPEMYLAFEILEYMLLETPAAPLRKALIDAGIGKDVFGMYDNSIMQPTFSIVVKNSNADKKDKFKEVVYDTLKTLVNKGIDKKLIESSINIKEFNLREADFYSYPKGLIYGMKCMDSWLYDGDPTIHLQYEGSLKKIKSALNTNYFEELIKKYILSNTHASFLVVEPCKGLEAKKLEETKKKLADYKSSLSNKELDEIIKKTAALKKRQTTPDSPEDIKKIPLLSIDDIDKKAEVLPLIEKEEQGTKVLFHPMFTNKIAYLNLYFKISGVDSDELPYIGLLSAVLGRVDTENYSYQDLSNEIDAKTGGISGIGKVYSKNGSVSEYTPQFRVSSKALTENYSDMVKLLKEVILHSKFDDKKRIREIIQEVKSRIEMTMFDAGNAVVAGRLLSYFSQAGKYIEKSSGFEFYKFISELEKNFDEKWDEISSSLSKVSKAIFNKNNLTVSVTSDEEDYELFKNNFHIIYDSLNDEKVKEQNCDFKLSPLNEGLMTSGKVQYTAKAFNFIKLGYKYTGSLDVLRTILRFDYLWNRVRVQGGAYGCSASFSRSGNLYFSSYRDPNLSETFNVYDEMSKYIENFNADEREMTKYIIGTIAEIDMPLTPNSKGQRSDYNYFCKITQEDIQKERDEILNTRVDDIRKTASLVKDCMKQNYICVLGNDDKIKENKKIFNNLINVFE